MQVSRLTLTKYLDALADGKFFLCSDTCATEDHGIRYAALILQIGYSKKGERLS
ncbi:hypothetical protein [Leptospira biflexa]|uniref:hypothetical protein n=1 Tax=Leptospira biflexa TaxID=172 RepID=UPI001FEE2A1C|nr:hypothetical protein [Leptospira biflexa]